MSALIIDQMSCKISAFCILAKNSISCIPNFFFFLTVEGEYTLADMLLFNAEMKLVNSLQELILHSQSLGSLMCEQSSSF